MSQALSANVKDRTRGIGGSDIKHLFNLKPYGCIRKLWYEKKGIPADYPFDGNAATRRGEVLEATAAEMYTQKTGRKVRRINKAYALGDWAVGHIDRQIIGTHSSGVLEIKVPGEFSFKKIKNEGLPVDYTLQLQHYLLLTGCQWGSFCILDITGWDILSFDVEVDDDWVEKIKEHGRKFWAEIITDGNGPERLEVSDKRCGTCTHRTKCQGSFLLGLLKGVNASDEIPFISDLAGIVNEYTSAQQAVKQSKEHEDYLKEKIKESLGEVVLAKTTGARITYKPVKTSRWDTKKLGKDKPELAAIYKKESLSRPLRIYPA